MATRIQSKIKKWGNSLGIIIPSGVALKENLRADDIISLHITKKRKLSEFFGAGTGKIVDAQKLKDEVRNEWMMH